MAGEYGCGHDEVLPAVDKPREECGIFGIYGPDLDVARLTYYGLYALQHRGQESAGIASETAAGFSWLKVWGWFQRFSVTIN
jgi:amidophosphoribosyltransferase